MAIIRSASIGALQVNFPSPQFGAKIQGYRIKAVCFSPGR
ncbi:hypothetical protein D1BOALGB6SA_3808 [Olavius sp. associated proteobacterium Delta 1]|nr:hypothetical protein D1BOALGB6SA_3808 [Olavius sp. associated proteobacterium Delta 1]